MNGFLNMLENEIARLDGQARSLAADARKDEANLARIRLNIFDVCKTVHGALLRKHGTEGFEAAYLAKLDEFQAAWAKSQDMAQQHGDAEKAMAEQVKLEALAVIREAFGQVYGHA